MERRKPEWSMTQLGAMYRATKSGPTACYVCKKPDNGFRAGRIVTVDPKYFDTAGPEELKTIRLFCQTHYQQAVAKHQSRNISLQDAFEEVRQEYRKHQNDLERAQQQEQEIYYLVPKRILDQFINSALDMYENARPAAQAAQTPLAYGDLGKSIRELFCRQDSPLDGTNTTEIGAYFGKPAGNVSGALRKLEYEGVIRRDNSGPRQTWYAVRKRSPLGPRRPLRLNPNANGQHYRSAP